jgi:hypothetical protein
MPRRRGERVKRVLLILAAALLLVLPLFASMVKSSGILEPPQVPVAAFTYTPSAPMPEETITFDASTSYAPGGYIVRYSWNFGDGHIVTTTNPVATHSYPADSNYTVELTVTDDHFSAGTAVAVVQVSTVVFFRVVYSGTLTPIANVRVTMCYYNGSAWVDAPVGPSNLEIKYDHMTEPDEANTAEERFRNPGYTASVLLSAANIGFDIHHSSWKVFFKFQWGSYTSYWPDDPKRIYTYNHGSIETKYYSSCHQAHWDPTASAYVIDANDVPADGVSPTKSHPIIESILCPPPSTQYYLKVKTDPLGVTTILGESWYPANTSVTLDAPTYVTSSVTTRYRFNYWDIDGTPKGTGVNPIVTTMNSNHTATAHYVLQYAVIFGQTGLPSDATGNIATVDGVPKAWADLPYTVWVDGGNSLTYSYNSPISSTIPEKQYRLNTVSGPSSPITVTGPSTVTGNYVTQYRFTFAQNGLDSTCTGNVVTVNGNPVVYGNLPYVLWLDNGGSVTYSFGQTVTSSISGKQFRLTGATGPLSPITITEPETITGNYVTQYKVTFAQTGLDSTASGTVATVSGGTKLYQDLPCIEWADSGSSITYSYADVVFSSVTGRRFKLVSVSGSTSPIIVTAPAMVTGNYRTQYQVTFDQSAVGNDFTGTVTTIDSSNYEVTGLPVMFWWDKDSSHSFSFASPLTVNSSKQYIWSSTSGLSSLQSGTLTVTASGSVIGNYAVQNCVIFDFTGINIDFTGTVIIIDGTSYTINSLPVSFYWQLGTTHTFVFQSPLLVAANTKQYVWTSTSGLSNLQSGSINVATFGSIVGNYKTQYYVNLPANPPGTSTPSGSGWYDAGTYAPVSTDQYVYGGSRYLFVNWTTADMSEITDPFSPTTTILVDKPKTVIANYVHQYLATFTQTGLGPDATGTVITVDAAAKTNADLPYSVWIDEGATVTYSYETTVFSTIAGKRFNLNNVTGPSSPIMMTSDTDVTGNYVVEFDQEITFSVTGVGLDFTGTVLTVDGTDYTVTEIPLSLWWQPGSWHTFSFSSPLNFDVDKKYVWTSTDGLSTSQSGSISITSSGSLTGNYKTMYFLAMTTDPPGVTTPSGSGWYDAGSNATISTTAFVDIVTGVSRYRFNGWTTTNISEIVDPLRSPTDVIMDEAKTVSALYSLQYSVAFTQTGVGSDFTGTIVTIDGRDFNFTSLSTSFWWDEGIGHTFSFGSPLMVDASKQYAWDSTAGLSTQQSGSMTVSSSGSVTGNYDTIILYNLTVTTSTGGITDPVPEIYSHQAGSLIQVSAVPNTSYALDYWRLDGLNVGSANPYTVTMNQNHALEAVFKFSPAAPPTVLISPLSASRNVGQPVIFTSTASGGTPSYTYQWYLDGNPVSGATSASWAFTPSSAGVYHVYLEVTDAASNAGQSSEAQINVGATPVGGYSVPMNKAFPELQISAYAMLTIMSMAALSLLKRKRK